MAENARGKLVVVSGPSGAGKSTLLARVLRQAEVPLVMSVSATTRPPRPGERNGVDYHFLSRQAFAELRGRGEFLECFEVFGKGDWYGTLNSEVTPSLDRGKWVVLEIDVSGAAAVQAKYPEAISVFVHPGSIDELERRLRGRGTEDEPAVARRLARARDELASAGQYRHQVINDDLDRAAGEVCDILKRYADAAQRD
ncbi:MAG: guanylate kinase [Pirellulales bacterium]|jgi:guanylate kinase|nr:guanylate kinase [Thermoguttaceae bacterium]MDD4787540.1 guanylate kinase [Pirellulales bacterium]MDI9443422.1 guanylate kinase [Planctomycetota bacterium]NLZ00428.1 guanylate kinase [Pirellulaceae bacterium]